MTALITEGEFSELCELTGSCENLPDNLSPPFTGATGRSFLGSQKSILFVGLSPGANEYPASDFKTVEDTLERERRAHLGGGGGCFWDFIATVSESEPNLTDLFLENMAWDNLLRINVSQFAPAPKSGSDLAQAQLPYCRHLLMKVVERTCPKLVVAMWGNDSYLNFWADKRCSHEASEFEGRVATGRICDTNLIWMYHPRCPRDTLAKEAKFIARAYLEVSA